MRQMLAVAAGKAILEVLRRTGRGGTAFPGLVASKLDPHILSGLTARLPSGSAMVIGTNGKTTTTRLIATILNQAGLKIVNNRSGSNLIRGLTSTLLDQSSLTGHLQADMGLFEVDEAAFPQACAQIKPKLILMNNLFRDQLDRYGEVDTIRKKWIETIKTLTTGTTLVLNADDPSLAYLATFAPKGVKKIFFGVSSPNLAVATLDHASDASKCLMCGANLVYEQIYISHMGHYQCPNGDFARPSVDFEAHAVTLQGTNGSQFQLATPDGVLDLKLGVPGLYNVYNAVGAAATTLSLGIAPANLEKGLVSFKSAFGRIERISLPDNKNLLLALVKNPVGFNEVLRMLVGEPDSKIKLMVIINDLFADGRDVSWLWDVDFEMLAGKVEWAMCSGIRATDMANRLKYAGVEVPFLSYESDIEAALKTAISRLNSGETLYIAPTYTAMLKSREVLQKMGLVIPFWEE